MAAFWYNRVFVFDGVPRKLGLVVWLQSERPSAFRQLFLDLGKLRLGVFLLHLLKLDCVCFALDVPFNVQHFNRLGVLIEVFLDRLVVHELLKELNRDSRLVHGLLGSSDILSFSKLYLGPVPSGKLTSGHWSDSSDSIGGLGPIGHCRRNWHIFELETKLRLHCVSCIVILHCLELKLGEPYHWSFIPIERGVICILFNF